MEAPSQSVRALTSVRGSKIFDRSFKDLLEAFLLLQVKRFPVKRFPRKFLVTRKLLVCSTEVTCQGSLMASTSCKTLRFTESSTKTNEETLFVGERSLSEDLYGPGGLRRQNFTLVH